MESIYSFLIQLIQGLQTMSPVLDGVMKLFSFLGTIEFYLLLIPFVYWVVNTQIGFRLLMVLISTDFLTLGFKQILRQPRPYWIGEVKALAEETSYGIPSSHASDSLAVWGYLAYRLKKNWLYALWVVMVGMIGLSRMYLPRRPLPHGRPGRLADRSGGCRDLRLGRATGRIQAGEALHRRSDRRWIFHLPPDHPGWLDHQPADRPLP
jgi:hypothetical protein